MLGPPGSQILGKKEYTRCAGEEQNMDTGLTLSDAHDCGPRAQREWELKICCLSIPLPRKQEGTTPMVPMKLPFLWDLFRKQG